MTLVEVVIGAALGFGFLWLCVVVGGRYSERRRDAGLALWRARMELRAIRMEAVERLMSVALRAHRTGTSSGPVPSNDDLEVIEGIVVDDEP